MHLADESRVPTGSLLLAALGLGLAAEVLFFGLPLGLNLLIAVALLLGVGWLVRQPGARVDPLDTWIFPAALAFAGLVALRSDPLLVLFDTLAAIALSGGAVLALAGIPVTRRSVTTIVLLGLWLAALMARGAAPLVRRLQPTAALGSVPGSRAVPVVRGLFLALPVLFVFGVLFAQADAVFARLASNVLQLPDLEDLPSRLLFAGVVAWGLSAVLWLVATRTADPMRAGADSTWAADPSDATILAAPASSPGGPAAAPERLHRSGPLVDRGLPLVGPTEGAVVLVAVDVLFAIFVVLQIAYLFGGRDTLAASGLTYSDYARRGFFELIAVVVLVGGLIVALESAVPRRTRAYLWAAVALVILAGVVLVSAFLRLRLYQDAYGWTELRFYALAAMAWLAVCLFFAALTLFADRTRWLLHAVAISALVVAVGVNLLDPPAYVAAENLARALEPSRVPEGGETGFDAVYVSALGYDAVPVILDALPRLPESERAVLTASMRVLRNDLRRDEGSHAWQAWNLARERARERLESDPGVR